jgi:tetratricopeptide (TPR) repeat protein
MNLKPTTSFVLILALIVGMAYSCSTEKDAVINVAYHNMTARYNGYYNAGVIIDEALTGYRTSYQENWEEILPIELYPSAEDVSSMFPPLDDAIERCSKVIVRHSMPNPEVVSNKKEEHCRWIDDNWLVIAQANYIKREYKEALKQFQYISDNYRGEESVFEANIWIAKTQIALGNYPEAKRIMIAVEQAKLAAEEKGEKGEKGEFIDRISKLFKGSRYQRQRQRKARKKEKEESKPEAEFPKRLIDDYEKTMADLFIQQKEYKKAIEHLELAIEATRKRKDKARLRFVLAQLYALQGNGSQASENYTLVARSNAAYEMRFKAKIRKALTASGGKDDLVKELNKMLKDDKNVEYKDQIYYALAELDMKDNDVGAAINNYSKSVLWSINNNRQKGISYLKLADIHFEKTDYLAAQRYYDSCVQVLPEEYPDFERLKNKADGLAELVMNYETVVYEDSVQRIANMSEKDRIKFIEKTIKNIEEEEARKKREAEQKLLAQQAQFNNQVGGAGNGSKWYFYNTKLVAGGFNEFRKLWGQRINEDNWRRANKNSDAQFIEEEEDSDTLQEEEGLTVEELLADIPLTNEALDSSNYRLINSLYRLGLIYKNQLMEEKQAITYFKEVINRNIEHDKVLPANYQLYLIYKNKNDASAELYKTEILNKYPDSEIAQILKDPDYLKKKEEKNMAELNEYSDAMLEYRRRRYGPVITKANEIITYKKENQYLNKYYLLKAFAISKIDAGNTEAISDPLKELVAIAPASEEGIKAKQYLNKIKSGEPIVPPDDEPDAMPQEVVSPYKLNMDSKHFFILVFPNDAGNAGKSKIAISNFNSNFYRARDLTLTNSPLGKDEQIFIVRSFKDGEDAMKYVTTFASAAGAKDLGNLAKDFDYFVINSANFATLFKEKDAAAYLEFYKANYK